MNDGLKHELVRAALLFKKVDIGGLCGGIPYGEMMVMDRVQAACPQGKLDVGKLAGDLCVSRPAVSQILRSLEEKGYILRQPDPADRRCITVFCTNEGSRALEQAQERHDESFKYFMNNMTLDELTTFTRLLDRFASVYNEMRHRPAKEEKDKDKER